MNSSRIILGTANFFNPYGIYNTGFNISEININDLIKVSLDNKITAIDTAVNYGENSDIIELQHKFKDFRIINKIKPDRTELMQVNLALTDTLLLHIDPRLNIGSDLLIQIMSEAKEKKSKLKVGVSVYNENDVASEVYDLCDTVQVPVSILDQTLLRSGFIEKLASKNIEIHARSIFLQGVLLNPPRRLKSNLAALAPAIDIFHTYCQQRNVSPLHACLDFILRNDFIDFSVCGFTSKEELIELCRLEQLGSLDISDLPQLPILNSEMLKPYNW